MAGYINLGFAILSLIAVCFVAGWLVGANWGIVSTERRWAETVARADDRRKAQG